MARKRNEPPDLSKYIERPQGRPLKRYVTYEQGARKYQMQYWTFVHLAKMAKANFPIRKTAIVDVDILDSFIETHPEEYKYIWRKQNGKTEKNDT